MALGDFGVVARATLLHLREVGVGAAIYALAACPEHEEWTLVKLRMMRNFRTDCDCEEWNTLFATLTCTRAKMLLEDFRACQTVEALAATFAAGAELYWVNEADAHEQREANCVIRTMEKALRPWINAVVVTDSMGEFVRRCGDDDGWERAVDVLSAFASLARVHGRRMVKDWVHVPKQIQGQCPS
jgi:hypothetical protein